MPLKQQTLDKTVATNLHADTLSHLAATLAGSLSIAPAANINPESDTPSMFEPIHGSAFDITGKGIAKPVATFWTGAMMLEHLGEKAAADRLMRAVERVTGDPKLHTPDLGGKATTQQVTDAVARRFEATTSERVKLTWNAAKQANQRGLSCAGSPYLSPVLVQRRCRGRVAGALRARVPARAAKGAYRRDRRG